jgi:DNA-directed RNA polymerase specialized sigma24 family protein
MGSHPTSMAGENGRFQPTRWTQIMALSTQDSEKHQKLLGELLSQYWKPIYCFIRRKGTPSHTAEDLTQGFVEDVILGRELISQADKNKGRFRTFVLTALERYLRDDYHKNNAQIRSPKGQRIPIDISEISDELFIRPGRTPEDIFNYSLASEILTQVLSEIETQYLSEDKEVYWRVFEEKVIKPLLEGCESPSNTEVCTKYGIKDEVTVSNMILTVKRRFKTIMRNCLRDLVHSESEVDEELDEIFQILSQGNAK